ncbi:MAG: tRNA 4-thiouridine(8) synthase ThiI [bacterium]|nr:tRNA 4-thiouridine(8) synthase ThiI [bacterium]
MNKTDNSFDGIHLFSGGLDSLISYFVLKDLGFNPLPIYFETPFFSSEKAKDIAEKNGIKLSVENVFNDYLSILKKPVYGYGKNLNPCIDCKAFMINKAIDIAIKEGLKYVSTGEVFNQRPMSQTFQGMKKIEKLLKRKDLLVRPLSGEILKGKLETNTIFKDKKLLSIEGRKREIQFKLAKKYNIKYFSSPSGGCLLTYKEYSEKIRILLDSNIKDERYFKMVKHCRLIKFNNSLAFIGRDKEDNEVLISLSKRDNVYQITDRKGPVGIFLGDDEKDFQNFLKKMLFYSKRDTSLPHLIKKIGDGA